MTTLYDYCEAIKLFCQNLSLINQGCIYEIMGSPTIN